MKRENCGWMIIEAASIGHDEEIVLGVKELDDGAHYVTWLCIGKTDYCMGHYFDSMGGAGKNLEAALRDYMARIGGRA